jgi:hypothetical protein
MSYCSPDLPLSIPVNMQGEPVKNNYDCGGPFKIKLAYDHTFTCSGQRLQLRAGATCVIRWMSRSGGHLEVDDWDHNAFISRRACVVLLRELHGLGLGGTK